MLKIQVCIGSTCFVEGSSHLIDEVNQYIQQHQLQEKVQLSSMFCIKACQNHQGLGVKINGEPYSGLTLADARDLFYQHIQAIQ